MMWMGMALMPVFLVVVVVVVVLIAVTLTANNSAPKTAEPDTLFVDETLLDLIDNGRKIEAIKYYRGETGSGLKAAKEAVEFIVANRDNLDQLSKSRRRLADDLPMGAGVKDLIAAGEFERAVETYSEFMGVDEYTARDAVQTIQDEIDDAQPGATGTL